MSREQVIRTAEKYVSKGRIDAAIREYRKVLETHPEDANTLNRLGDLYARIERYDDAVQLFEQIAEAYTDDGFFVKAIAIYKKIIKLDPTRLEIYERLAELYHKQGLINEARTQYQVLADYYLKHDNPTSAINVYRKMAELEPENPSHHAKLAELYAANKLIDKAMGEYATIAELMIDHGHPEDAAQVYRKALDIDDTDIPFITDAVMRLKEAGHIAEAARFLAIAAERNPEARGVARLVGMEKEKGEDKGHKKAPEPVVEPTVKSSSQTPPKTQAKSSAPAETPQAGEKAAQAPSSRQAPTERPSVKKAPTPPPAATEKPAREGPEATAKPWLSPEARSPLEPEAAGGTGVAEPGPPETDLESSEAELVLDLDETAIGTQAFDEAAGSADLEIEQEPAERTSAAPEIEVDLEDSFVLDLEDDEPSPSLVAPPPDMLDGRPARAFLPDEAEEAGTAGPPEIEAGLGTSDERPDETPGDAAIEEMDLADVMGFEMPIGEEELAEAAAEAAAEKTVRPTPRSARATGKADIETVDFDPEVLEQTVSDLQPAETHRDENELVSEAEVLAKYDMIDKALERLRDALALNPDNLEAHEVRLRIHLDRGEQTEIPRLAQRMAVVAETVGDTDRWPRMQQRLERAGFRFDQAAEVAPPTPPEPKVKAKPSSEERVNRLLHDLLGDVVPRPKRRRKPAETPLPIELEPEIDTGEIGAQDAVLGDLGPLEETPQRAPLDDITLHGIFDEVAVPDLPEKPPETAPEKAPYEPPPLDLATPETTESPTPDDTGTSWLDEVEQETARAPHGDLFENEDEFFDLAGELEEELSRAEALDPAALVQPEEQSLEEIVEGFKQGVAENLSPEDHDTHFNLGIAYREMGLLDEAIGEFQVASKSRRHLVECCSMLGLCFLDKGLPELAVKWYRQGLATADLTEEETLGLLYDMGNVYLATEDHEAAQKTFVELYGINSNYRDVVAKLEDLKKG